MKYVLRIMTGVGYQIEEGSETMFFASTIKEILDWLDKNNIHIEDLEIIGEW